MKQKTMKLDLVDQEAALAADGASEGGLTRLDLLRRAAVGTGALLGAGLLVSGVPKAFAATTTDLDILNVLHLNEALEAAFYSQAVERGALTGTALDFARQVGANETVHRDTVRHALGSHAKALPGFDFGDTTASQDKFLATSLVLENNDVAANNGAGPLLRSKKVLAVAGQIVSVEGRQAAWIRRIVYGPEYDSSSQYPAPKPFDAGISLALATRRLESTGFIQERS